MFFGKELRRGKKKWSGLAYVKVRNIQPSFNSYGPLLTGVRLPLGFAGYFGLCTERLEVQVPKF